MEAFLGCGSTPIITKHHFLGGMLIAKAEGGVLTYLHSDHLGSVVLETNTAGNVVNDQRYYAYGRRLDTGGDISGEKDFTGQRKDATGLVYMNARYYDPTLEQFISPDTIVPDPNSWISYNRYLYGYGNPVKYNDPSGHGPYATDGGGSAPISNPSNNYNATFVPYHSIATYYHMQDRTWEQLPPDVRLVFESSGYTSYSDLDVGGNTEELLNLVWPDSGAVGIGISGSAGMGVDAVAGVCILCFDHEGNVVFGGLTLGLGGNSGANVDANGYITVMPTASSVDIFNGTTVSSGVSGGLGPGAGIEVNATKDPKTDEPAIGTTLTAGVSAKLNVPA